LLKTGFQPNPCIDPFGPADYFFSSFKSASRTGSFDLLIDEFALSPFIMRSDLFFETLSA
jgi:hypothetical protein